MSPVDPLPIKYSGSKIMQSELSKQDSRQCFIDNARRVHGDKYSYDSVAYENSKTKVIILCKALGVFSQTPSSHLAGCGCKGCGIKSRSIKRRQSLNDFIDKARHRHGDKYCYDKIKNYLASSMIPIVCPDHGLFMMEPSNHLIGQGCKYCGMSRRANKCRSSGDEFVARAYRVHGNRYGYTQVNYINARVKVVIECAKHGPFQQYPDSHLAGRGCKSCGVEQRGKFRELGMRVHIERAREKHKDFYDYALVPTEGNARDKVKIGCPEHGFFSQDFYQHSRGVGCPECWSERRGVRKKNEVFIHEAKNKHGAKYDYSKVEYINAYTKIKIICVLHGLFEVTPTKHLGRGDGCPECGFLKRKGIGGVTSARLKKELELGTVDAWVYIACLENDEERFFKFGHTTNVYPENRFSFFSTYSWTIEYAVSKPLCEALRLEDKLKLGLPRYNPKLKFSGYTECTLEDPGPLLKKLLYQGKP